MTVTPQQSAYRERPVAAESPSPPQKLKNAETAQRHGGAEPKAGTASLSYEYENHPPPLAKTNTVRENTTKKVVASTEGSRGTRQESIKQKAVNDPVVQEVVRLFKAEIKDIHQK